MVFFFAQHFVSLQIIDSNGAMCRLLHKSSGENTKIKGGVPNVKK
nr:MAG TPA: hypothetical protein [Caudoviricetes sp.]